MRALVLAFLLAGCSGDSGSAMDLSAAVDLARVNIDLFGVDYAGDYNCAQLNACVSDPLCNNQLCQQHCRDMSTPSALMKQDAVQQCLASFCPPASTCLPDGTGMLTDACKQCLKNTQVPLGSQCTPTGAAECHGCLIQVTNCRNDQ